MENDFCVFILTHGRPDRIYTLKTLEKAGYTGKIFIIVDNEDAFLDEYKARYGNKVIVFDKKAISETFDTADNFNNRKTIVYARNACFNIAKELSIKHFMELDDDYISLDYRFNAKGEFKHKPVKTFDKILEAMITFYDRSGATAIAFAQGGDFIGGKEGMGKDIRIKRKAMNTILCSTERPFTFLGRINEDVNTYVREGMIGKLFFTINAIGINQKDTQSNKGGMTDVYLESGTYLKSFYTIMFAPSCVKISRMGNTNMRIHHKIHWNNAVPRILNEKYKLKG